MDENSQLAHTGGMTAVPGKRSAGGAPVVALVCVGIFMTTLDASIVNIGLPSIATAFGTTLTGSVEWIVIGYLVVIAALLLTFGRLSDMIGRSPIAFPVARFFETQLDNSFALNRPSFAAFDLKKIRQP